VLAERSAARQTARTFVIDWRRIAERHCFGRDNTRSPDEPCPEVSARCGAIARLDFDPYRKEEASK
jgi:hypothetical protein